MILAIRSRQVLKVIFNDTLLWWVLLLALGTMEHSCLNLSSVKKKHSVIESIFLTFSYFFKMGQIIINII